MAGQASNYEREVRDTIVKSGLTGVAAAALAVTFISPAGFGGMIGETLASNFGFDSTANAADNPYANLPAYPAPLSQSELSQIRGQLASTAAQMEFTRAATEAKIEHVRAIAVTDGAVTFSPMPEVYVPQLTASAAPQSQPQLRLTLSEPVSMPVAPAAPAQLVEVSYSGTGGGADYVPYRDSHMELADLLFAHEEF